MRPDTQVCSRLMIPVLALIGAWVVLVGATAAEPPNLREYPKVDGSTTTQPLQQEIMKRVLKTAEADIRHSGTHHAYTRLINGEVDFILVSRSPSQDELGEARKKGVSLEDKPIALNALVFIVHRHNPIESLTSEEIRGIFGGKIAAWDEVGVPGLGKIHAYTRERNSGSQELMERLVMPGSSIKPIPISPVIEGEGGRNLQENMWLLVSAVAGDECSLGYTLYHYATFIVPKLRDTVARNLRVIGVDSVEPSPTTIAARTYPFTTSFVAVIRSNTPTGHPAVKIRDWLLTQEGKAVISDSHYVPHP
ncbi:MAG: substrate-binding domain-containing protein [Thermodesulfobacteriota bacterium]